MALLNSDFYHRPENQRLAAKLSRMIYDILRGMEKSNRIIPGRNVTLTAYLLSKAIAGDLKDSENKSGSFYTIRISDICAPDVFVFWAQQFITEDVWQELLHLAEGHSAEQFALAALQNPYDPDKFNDVVTPDSIVKLAIRLLDIKEHHNVADLCCGLGGFTIRAALTHPNAHYDGFDFQSECVLISKMRAELIDAFIDIQQQDVFEVVPDHKRYDRVFANYPFGVQMRDWGGQIQQYAKLRYPWLKKTTSGDWLFNSQICDMLNENGRAVAIMTNGSTWNSIDAPFRKHFIEQGLIECVIALPERMFASTSIPTTMIVFSRGNTGVRMIDASKLCERGRRQNEFSESQISQIVAATKQDCDYSAFITEEELYGNEFSLSLGRYLKIDASFENGVPFESVIKSITRGAPCTASELDEMASMEETNMQYLTLSSIQDGIIDADLPYLSAIDPKLEKYCLKENSLLMSKNGYPYKIAVAQFGEEKKVLANGNLYIVEVDQAKVNPFYLKAFFESDAGVALLKSITVGATIPNIGVDKLKKVLIPLPPMDVQKSVAEQYVQVMEEIKCLKKQLAQTVDRLRGIYETEMA